MNSRLLIIITRRCFCFFASVYLFVFCGGVSFIITVQLWIWWSELWKGLGERHELSGMDNIKCNLGKWRVDLFCTRVVHLWNSVLLINGTEDVAKGWNETDNCHWEWKGSYCDMFPVSLPWEVDKLLPKFYLKLNGTNCSSDIVRCFDKLLLNGLSIILFGEQFRWVLLLLSKK